MILELQTVAAAMGARWDGPPEKATGWSVDTRTQQPGDVYFALRGPNHDGHDYVDAALGGGAAAVVVDGSGRADSARAIHVADPLAGLQQLGRWARREWGGRVVGVTGSAGKTTTKDAIAHLLSVDLSVGKTIGNLNNHVGVPLSILRLPGDARAAVLEMGMNHSGEIRDLAAIARPDIGVVTMVGFAHVEFFASIEGVAAAKRELIEGLPRDGVAVLNADDPRVALFAAAHPGRSVTFGFGDAADVRAEEAELRADGSRFRVRGVEFETALPGRHTVMNLLAAIAVAGEFGIAPERLRDAVRGFAPGKMRGERIERDGVVIWNDCYNSNPEAAQSMLDVLRETPAARRIAVLGEMLELGGASAELHRRVGRYAAEQGIDLVIGVRGAARDLVRAAEETGARGVYFEDPAPAGEFARSQARTGDAVLFKGSRGVKVELALERFLA
ncbi:MAG: UDP-N-acetylmuramoyl-tripeptide--D-alanyl-D-alanine ligase [Acidobacteria bacterium]|nr:UDP-N-acetylmuramoyl-tripeptide--D-alanyl-D-alanine ligase [Acidobacteriota bacterium]